MRRWSVVPVAATLVMCVPVLSAGEEVTEAEAQVLTLSCGEIKNSNQSYQFGTGLWLEYNAQTRRTVQGGCPWIVVGVEAYVVGVSNSARENWDLFTAMARRQIPVPWPAEWQVNSNHYRSWFGVFTFSNGSESSRANVTLEEEEPTSDGSSEDPLLIYNSYNTNIVSPIVIDSGRDGFRLTSVEEGVLFDIDADGLPDRVAWTHPDGDDEFLALDRNGNGRIDDGSELFGNYTPVLQGTAVTAANGFEALAFTESPRLGRSLIDRRIDARDAAFPRLVLWRDANHNGVSEPGELRPVSHSGLLVLETAYETARRRDRYGNEFRQRAKAVWADGEFYVYDIWLRRESQ